MSRLSRMLRYQHSADDVGIIAETTETLAKMLDTFHADHGTEIYERLMDAFPDASELVKASTKLYAIERDLTPPDSDDEARQAWRKIGGHT